MFVNALWFWLKDPARRAAVYRLLPRVPFSPRQVRRHTVLDDECQRGAGEAQAVPRTTTCTRGLGGASPAILRPFRDSHFVTSRRRACRQDVGGLLRKTSGKAHCVLRLPRFTGTGAIHRRFPTFGSFGFPLGLLVRGRSVSDRVEARLLTRPLNFTLWLMQRCLKRGRWAQGTNP